MRLKPFESAGVEPLGEGDEKKVFIDPKNEARVISERKEEGTEKDTVRQLKGRYYLTKIAHLLLPTHIPEVYQAGESVDGNQSVDSERIAHSPGQTLLQELRRSGQNEKPAVGKIMKDQGRAMRALDGDLQKIGLDFVIDENVGNYTKNEAGDTYYLETFKPWQANGADPEKFEILFDEEVLREAINGLSDQKTKDECLRYLERLLTLAEEEKKNLKEAWENRESSLLDCKPGIEKFEATIAPFLEESVLASLHAIKSYKKIGEILSNEERNRAKATCTAIYSQLEFLKNKTDITAEVYEKLYEEYKVLDRAIGSPNAGIVDHER